MSKAKIVWVSLGSLFLVGALAIGVYLVFQNQNIARKAAPATTLSISPGSQNIAPGSPFSFTVQMSTGENQITVFDLAINFDQSIFQIDSVTPGSSVPSADFSLNGNTHANGEIFYGSFTTDVTKALSGSGLTILNVSGTVKPDAAAGTYNFTFGSDTVMSGLDETQNVLTGTTPGSVIVAGAADPTATPTATPAETATPTPAPTGTSGSGATPTPRVTPTTSSGSSSSTTVSPTPRPLPVTGLSLTTVVFGIAGLSAVIMSFVIALF